MMEKSFFYVEPFDVCINVENIGARWTKWINRFDNYLVAADIGEDARKEALLLHCVGENVYDTYCSLPDIVPSNKSPPGNELSNYDKAKLKLSTYFVPKANIEFELFNFRQAKQSDSETVDQYYARLLKLSKNCNFADTDREIKSQIILTTTSTSLRRYALREQPTLQQLLTQAKTYETTEEQAKQIENKATAPVARLNNKTINNFNKGTGRNKHNYKQTVFKPRYNKYNNYTAQKSETCRNCGGPWHTNGRKHCPAVNVKCHFCQKQGHYAKVCISAATNRPKQHWENKQRSQVNFNEKESDTSDEAFFCLSVNNLNTVPKTKVMLNGQELSFVIDTGSTVNLINNKVFQKFTGENLIEDATQIMPYNTNEN